MTVTFSQINIYYVLPPSCIHMKKKKKLYNFFVELTDRQTYIVHCGFLHF